MGRRLLCCISVLVALWKRPKNILLTMQKLISTESNNLVPKFLGFQQLDDKGLAGNF